MTIASFLSSRRRVIAVCAASALLHAVAIGWAGQHWQPAEHRAMEEPAPIVAVMLKAPAPPAAPRPPVPVRKAAPPAPAPGPVRRPQPAAEPVLADAQELAAAPVPLPELAADALALPEIEAPAEAQPQPEPATPVRYRVSLPPSSQLTYDVTRKDAKGAEFSGASEVLWQHAGGSYKVSAQTFLNALITRVGVMRSSSEGTITEDGIVPRRMLEKRMGRAETATHFDPAAGRITFSRSERSVALMGGAQDRASLQFQLAGIARADSAQLSAGVEIQVGSERDATPYAFVLAGEETIDTPIGRLATWRLTRAPRPGSYSARLDIWLAPQHDWLPVQVRSLEPSGAVTTQTIRKIVVTDTGNG